MTDSEIPLKFSEMRDYLILNAEERYRIFSSSLLPGIENIIGIRIPKLRKTAKIIVKSGCASSWLSDYYACKKPCFEETMTAGFITAYTTRDFQSNAAALERFIPKIDNWSVCDSFSASLKAAETDKDGALAFIDKYRCGSEFEVRFFYVVLLNYFIDSNNIDFVLEAIDGLSCRARYAYLAAAWALAECYVNFPEKTEAYLKQSNLDDETYNAGLRKICESLKTDAAVKKKIKRMMR